MWIKRNIVMLCTNEKANNCPILYFPKTGRLNKRLYSDEELQSNRGLMRLEYTTNHLCVLSDEEIKKGEILPYVMCWTDGTYELFNSNNSISESKRLSGLAKKIIATTDKLILKISKSINKEQFPDILVPQPSQSFIEYFISEYNKGNIITEVMVEYDVYYKDGYNNWLLYNKEFWDKTGNKPKFGTKSQLKINPDNTINIKPIKNSKYEDLYKAIDKIKEGHKGSAINFIERFINTQIN